MAEEYGEFVCTRHEDGSVTVDRADPVIAVSAELLVEADPALMAVDGAGNLVLCGHVYRPARFARVGARVLICERVNGG